MRPLLRYCGSSRSSKINGLWAGHGSGGTQKAFVTATRDQNKYFQRMQNSPQEKWMRIAFDEEKRWLWGRSEMSHSKWLVHVWRELKLKYMKGCHSIYQQSYLRQTFRRCATATATANHFIFLSSFRSAEFGTFSSCHFNCIAFWCKFINEWVAFIQNTCKIYEGIVGL